ncbi:unnamed protein product [Cunninghamella blakesleeana]
MELSIVQCIGYAVRTKKVAIKKKTLPDAICQLYTKYDIQNMQDKTIFMVTRNTFFFEYTGHDDVECKVELLSFDDDDMELHSEERNKLLSTLKNAELENEAIWGVFTLIEIN